MLKSPIITRKTVNISPTGTERRKEPCFQVVRPPPVCFLFSLFIAVGLPKIEEITTTEKLITVMVQFVNRIDKLSKTAIIVS